MKKTLKYVKGSDCLAGDIVVQVNKLRHKAGKGDPRGFQVFLDSEKLPQEIIPRYRGNRLHVLIHICGTLFEHLDNFERLLNSRTSGVAGSGNNRKLDYWSMDETILYQSHGSDIEHGDGIQHVKEVLI